MEKDELKKLWEGFIKSLKSRISTAHLSTYFQGTMPLEINSYKVLIIGIPNAFIKETLEKKYGEDILEYFSTKVPDIKKVEFKTIQFKKEDSVDVSSLLKENYKEKREESEVIQVSEKFTLQNFIVGSNNELAYAASKAVANKPGRLYNPLFIYGGVGLGKTHLLQAIANEIKSKMPEKTIVYITAETFTNDLIDSIARKNVRRFRYKYRDSADVLIIDDVQFLQGKEKTQEELFHTFNILKEKNSQIILSADRPPVELKTLEERLISRFASGMVADIAKPDVETRIAILRSKMQEKGFLVEMEVLNLIAESIDSNIRDLESVLKQVLDESDLMQVDPSIDLVEKVIRRLFPIHKSSFNQRIKMSNIDYQLIINLTAELFEVTPEALIGKSREKEIATPRHLAMYLIREFLKSPLEAIGQIFGNRNHTTVMHAIEKTKESLKHDMRLIKIVNKIRTTLGM